MSVSFYCLFPVNRFCPSVLIYLMTSVPAIWFLELYEFDKRANYLARLVRAAYNQTTFTTALPTDPEEEEDLSASVGSLLGVRSTELFHLKVLGPQIDVVQIGVKK